MVGGHRLPLPQLSLQPYLASNQFMGVGDAHTLETYLELRQAFRLVGPSPPIAVRPTEPPLSSRSRMTTKISSTLEAVIGNACSPASSNDEKEGTSNSSVGSIISLMRG